MSETSMLAKVLKAAVQRGATDVHAKAGDVFRARVDGHLVPLTKQRLTPAQTRALAATFAELPLDSPRLDALRDFDCSWGLAGVGRFRVNVLRQRSSFMVVMRVIPFNVPTPESLGLPEPVTRLADAMQGLVIVAGPSGGGKTAAIAAMVHHVNRSSARHVLTIEDPIEYLHRDLTGSITQRELGTDTDATALAIQASLRQDPDVLVIGELRDDNVLDRAIRAVEAGRLVITAVAAPDVLAALNLLLATMPPAQREVGAVRLAAALHGVAALRRSIGEPGAAPVTMIEWIEATESLRTAVAAGGELAPLRKAFDKAAKEGRAEGFTPVEGVV